MRVTDQLALVCALLAVSSEANPLTQKRSPNTFSAQQVARPAHVVQYPGRNAMARVRRKFGQGGAPPAAPPVSPTRNSQKPLKKFKKAKSKANAPAGAGETQADSAEGDQEYVCEVEVGGQKTRLNFDTGSSDLYVTDDEDDDDYDDDFDED